MATSPVHANRTSGVSTSGHRPVEVPTVWDAPQLVLARVLEGQSGSRDQVLHGRRDEDLAGSGKRTDARGDVHGDTSDIAVDRLDLARVAAGSDLEAQRSNRVHDRLRAPHGAGGSIERREEPIPGRVDLPALIAGEEPSDQVVVRLEQLLPSAVVELSCPL